VSSVLHSDWIVPNWPAPRSVRALITTRAGGVSAGPYASFNLGAHVGDDPACVARNRDILRACLPAEPRWLKQVHGTRVVAAREAAPETEADGAVSRAAHEICAALVADCLPVLLCDREASVVGVAHAGWRGMSSGVIEAVVSAMRATPSSLMAYLGPAISGGAYEVGEDVRDAFVRSDPGAAAAFAPRAPGKFLADLEALARRRLAACGIVAVYGGGMCTASDGRFFSFRRDRITGRMAALIWLENE
jgi:YfiH family protein